MHGEYTNKSAPTAPRCPTCGTPMQLVRRTSRFRGLPDLYSFYCLACDAWHVEEGNAVIGQRAVVPQLRQLICERRCGPAVPEKIARVSIAAFAALRLEPWGKQSFILDC